MRSLAIRNRTYAYAPQRAEASNPSAISSSPYDRLGNRAMQRLLAPAAMRASSSGRAPSLQTKSLIGEPGDRYEQDADRIADQVMSAPATPSKTAPCACGGRCEACADATSAEEAPLVQPKRISEGSAAGRVASADAAPGSSAASVHAAMPAVDAVLAQPGQPLDGAARDFMESRFGHDFGSVRVHLGDAATRSASALGAAAYTVGRHLVFDRGYYQPGTDAGRHLIAHELAHTVQQGATGASSGVPALQRAMKFELQTGNLVRRVKGAKSSLLPRKYGPSSNRFLHKGTKGKPASAGKEGTAVELQSEARGFLEFETPSWLSTWCDVKERIQEAVDMVDAINNAPVVGTAGGVKTVEFPFDTKHLKKNEKTFPKGLVSGEALQVEIKDPKWFAKIQASESFELSQFDSYMSEHHDAARSKAVRDTANALVLAANTAGISPGKLINLGNFMRMIVDYIRGIRVFNTDETASEEKKHLAKENISLMSRTNFASIYHQLLSKDEQTIFKRMVSSGAILTEFGLSKTDLVYPSGFLGRKSPGPTVHDWLVSIHATKRDLLSSLGGDNRAMGRFDVETTPGKKDTGLVKFEARGIAGHNQVRPAVAATSAHGGGLVQGWVHFAEEVFKAAATKRSRSGKTALKYDPGKCP